MKQNPEKTGHWRQQVEAYKASGISRKEYCEKNQIKLSTFDYWRKKFSSPGEKKGSAWIPIKIAEDSSLGIDLRVGSVTIAVKPGFDRALLTELLQTISAIC
jgi:hypothetical protein